MFKNQGDTWTNGQFIIEKKKEIGRGAYGVVYDCIQINSNAQLCAKIIKSLSSNSQYLNRESDILQTLSKSYPDNPNLVKVYFCQYQIIEGNDVLIVIMEKCFTNLKDELASKKNYSSEEVIDFLRQLLNGYKPLYEKCILHRDLKPENILISKDNRGQPQYKISDFGIGKINANNDFNITKVGTPVYAAPELNSFVNDEYLNDAIKKLKDIQNGKSQVDVYSIGIMLYQLLFGEVPFQTQFPEQLVTFLKDLKKNNAFFQIQKSTANINPDLVELIQKMIVYDPYKRIKFQEIYSHQLINIQPEQPQKFQQFKKQKQQPQSEVVPNIPQQKPQFLDHIKNNQPAQQQSGMFAQTQNQIPTQPFIQIQSQSPYPFQPNMRSTMQAVNQFQINNNLNNNQNNALRFPTNQSQNQFRQTDTGQKMQFAPLLIQNTAQNQTFTTPIQINQVEDPINYLTTQLSENQFFYCQQTKKLLEQALDSIKSNNQFEITRQSKALMEFYKMEKEGQYSLNFLKFYYCLIRKAYNQQIEKSQFTSESELKTDIENLLKQQNQKQ